MKLIAHLTAQHPNFSPCPDALCGLAPGTLLPAPGHPDAVSTTYGYHIMYYRGNEQPAWRAEVREELVDEAYSEWEAAAKAAYESTESPKIEKLWSKVSN